MVFDRSGAVISREQLEHRQIFPKAGWVEHDAAEIWVNTRRVAAAALASADLRADHIVACGLTNQRETTCCGTGPPANPCITPSSGRTPAPAPCERLAGDAGVDRYKDRTGLPLSTYFSGPKITWLLEEYPSSPPAPRRANCVSAPCSSWLAWNLTGGPDGGQHITDVTNASRTMLMDIRTLQWDPEICADFGIPMSLLPEIRSSSKEYGPMRDKGPARRPARGDPGRSAGRHVRAGLPVPGEAKTLMAQVISCS